MSILEFAEENSQRKLDIMKERNEHYGDNFLQFGKISESLFPDGLTIKGVDEFNRLGVIVQILSKLTRYAANFNKGGHSDSLDDLANYTTILQYLDEQGLERASDELTRGISGYDNRYIPNIYYMAYEQIKREYPHLPMSLDKLNNRALEILVENYEIAITGRTLGLRIFNVEIQLEGDESKDQILAKLEENGISDKVSDNHLSTFVLVIVEELEKPIYAQITGKERS